MSKHPPPTKHPRLLTPQQVADVLGLSVSTICAMLRQRTIPSILVSLGRGKTRTRGIRRVDPDDLDRWIAARRQAGRRP